MRKVQKRIEDHFKMTFPEVVAKHFHQGMSRYQCTAWLNQQLGIENEQSPEAIKSSTVWNMVDYGIKHNLIVDFSFNGRNKENPRYRVLKTKKQKELDIDLELTCMAEGPHRERIWHSSGKIDEHGIICLRSMMCPECNQFGTALASFEIAGIKVFKAVLENEGIRTEYFVDEEINVIDNPMVSIV